ncbi:GntR family transcriptional regulator [Olivibacter sp. LS-1]|uniref:GntR family transcriptional regulator n=1 Tax=Olivibacter sp. LS-1 TaxID=2592345 RepID=UPI0011EB02D7|nr:GntR family transcriptional regulator [Olivibacter sp. LS-1]QEL00873.1 GntR family transcriptional regulator [Olivibacter sp. LS-1]
MNNSIFFDHIRVDNYSSTPKYLQLAYAILSAVKEGKFQKDNVLPSLNELTNHLEISRETADRGYKYLRYLGILKAVPGKGHFISTTEVNSPGRICLLVNKISEGKSIFYHELVASLGNYIPIDFYVYNNDFFLFKRLLNQRRDYSHYVILPHFFDNQDEAEALIDSLPKDKLILLDKRLKRLKGNHSTIYEDFEGDIYQALEKALPALEKYHTLKLILHRKSYLPNEIKRGFNKFCQQYAFERAILDKVDHVELNSGEVYICVNDDDMVNLLDKVSTSAFVLGKDLGIISYNEAPLKKYIAGGITTISTDYKQMASLTAQSIKENTPQHIALNFCLQLRGSL